MPIQYYLVENHLTPDPNDYSGVVHPLGTLSEEDIIREIIADGSVKLSAGDMRLTLETFHRKVQNRVIDGFNVVTPHVQYRSVLTGIFQGKDDGFDASRHSVSTVAVAGKQWSTAYQQASLKKMEAPARVPLIEVVTDYGSSTRDAHLSPGNMVRVLGHRLKIHDPADAQQGIFLVPDNGGAAVRVTEVFVNTPKELMFRVPPTLAAGAWALEVRTILPGAAGRGVRVGTTETTLARL